MQSQTYKIVNKTRNVLYCNTEAYLCNHYCSKKNKKIKIKK